MRLFVGVDQTIKYSQWAGIWHLLIGVCCLTTLVNFIIAIIPEHPQGMIKMAAVAAMMVKSKLHLFILCDMDAQLLPYSTFRP